MAGQARREPAERSGAPTPDGENFDFAELKLANKRVTRSPRRFGALLAGALRTVWSVAPRQFVAAMVLTVLNALIPIVLLLVTVRLLDLLLAGDGVVALAPLLPYLIALAVLTACSLGLSAAIAQVQRLLGELVMRDTQRKMLDVTTTVGLATYETPWFFNYVARVEANAMTKPADIAQAVVAIVAGGIAGAGLSVVLLVIDPLLLPVLAATALPNVLIGRRGGRAEFRFARRQSAGLRERQYLAAVLKWRDTAKEIRAFELAGLLRGRWERNYRDYLAGLREVVGQRLRLSVGAAVLTGTLLLGAVLLLLWRVRTGDIALAEAGAALVGLRLLGGRIQASAGGGNKLYESQLFLRDLHEFLELRGQRPAPAAGSAAAANPSAGVGLRTLSLENVSFRYPGSSRLAIDDVSLEIRKGEVVALVGENGAGKTTLATLLAGLHEPTSGAIYWGGLPTAELDPAVLRSKVAVIFQDFARFELSALENIAAGRGSAPIDRAAARAAAEQAGVAELIRSLPSGYDTLLGKAMPGGVDLSLGQWQRIALARAIYRDAPFVVLDEPTSALDARAEHDLFARMREVFAGRTVLVISHRFSSVRHADRVYVLDSGRIAESGTHAELMRGAGVYRELFSLQAGAYLPG